MAALAYVIKYLVPGLYLYSARRKPQGKGKNLSEFVSGLVSDRLLARRKLYSAPLQPGERVPLGSKCVLCAAPILVHGDIEGGVLLPGSLRDEVPDAETVRAAATAADFLARWMEE